MDTTYWQKQNPDKPLFPDLSWSKPENKQHAGKLLIVGGNLHAFAAPAEAFTEAEKAGVGTVRVLLPDAAKKLVGAVLPQIEYAPSTPSGSFSQKALAELLDASHWADGVLIAGDLGRNSETSILLEKFIQKYPGRLALAKDAVDYALQMPQAILGRSDTLLALSFAQLQKLAISAGYTTAFTFQMDLLRFIETLHDFTQTYQVHLITQHLDQIHCAVQGNIISTPVKSRRLPAGRQVWRVKTAAHASVWWLQNPAKPLEAYANAILEAQA